MSSSSSVTTTATEPPPSPRVHRRRRWVGAAAVAVVLVLATAAVIWRTRDGSRDLAAEAVVTASSTAQGFSARDAVTSGSASSPGPEWRSAGETIGAWVELSWSEPHDVRQVVLVRNPLDEPGVTDGFLGFGDGSSVQVTLSTTSRETVVPVTPRAVDRLRFTVSRVAPGAQHAAVAEILVSSARDRGDVVVDDTPDGNAAPRATVSASGGDVRALTDGSGAPGPAGVGADWTAGGRDGTWVQLNWERPRELSSIALVGSGRPGANSASATLTFGDGARLPVGAVPADPARPTVVSFMPRVTRSLRLTVDRVTGTGPPALAELRAYERGATPVRSVAGADMAGAPPPPGPGACAAPSGSQPARLVVTCPTTGAAVDGRVDLQVSVAPGYSALSATPWPADEAVPAGPVGQAAPDAAGAATVPVDLSGLPPGPVTVRVEATGEGKRTDAVDFPLYHRGGAAAADLPSAAPAAGRTLVYDEEFDRPVAVSRTGVGADYGTSKPMHDGVQDFGDAVFADPARGVGNIGVVDDRYLRIGVEPTPAGYPGAPAHVGGLLASARPGGSGFSAQYGYFEARMLMPAAPGTWPAFWMLPSDNLVAPTPVVAEIDAVEHYGHNPTGACHSTHGYEDGRDGGVARCGQRFATDRSAVSWHTYGVSVLPTGITFYLDGQVVATAPQVAGGGAPMFFLVNLALGGGWPVDLGAVQDRAALYVDYVRVFV